MMQWCVWAACLGLLTGCQLLSVFKKQTITLDGSQDVELVLYQRVGNLQQRVMSPVGLMRGGQSIELEPGDYMLANECSGYEFKHSKDRPSKVPVRRLILTLHGENSVMMSGTAVNAQTPSDASAEKNPTTADTTAETAAENEADKTADVQNPTVPTGSAAEPTAPAGVVYTKCTDPLDQYKNQWDQRREFDILPGTTELQIGGRSLKFENHGESSEPLVVDLYPMLISSRFDDTHARFYVSPEEKDPKIESEVVSLESNKPIWLLPGQYVLEVNGTRRTVSVDPGARTDISVGVLRIDLPSHFPLEERLKAGGQPVFVYLDTGALLNMNTDYVVFPGSYTVSIEGSEVQDTFQVEADEKTTIQTFAARVDTPACPEAFKSCKNPPRVTIHREQKPYALMTVEPRLPFLLLEGTYEYGVEGLRGIKRILQRRTDSLAGEPLARVRLKWDVRQAQGRYRTDLVRIESRGQNNFGRSLDLLFHKPDEVYVPAGNYDLTYFVGDPLLERSKSRQSLNLEPGQTRELVVPVFVEKTTKTDEGQNTSASRTVSPLNSNPTKSVNQQKQTPKDEDTPAALPRSLTPLRR